MRKTREEAKITRQKLLEAALAVFSRNGYDATRLEDIAAEAGVTRGAIYHHFGSKPELYTTLTGEMWERVMPVLEQAMTEGGSPVDILRRSFIRKMSFVEEDDAFRAINELIMFKTAVIPELEDGMRMKRDGVRQAVNIIAGHVTEGIEQGLIRPSVNARDMALAYYALQDGLMALWLIDPALFSLKEQAAAAVDMFLKGILA
jgi:TetR/AcrR family acrAB operon transcriptional repressor